MKFGTAVGIMIAVPIVTIVGIWTSGVIRETWSDYLLSKKVDQVYENFLNYGPEFLGEWWNITESYLQTGETRRSAFDQDIQNLYRDSENKNIYIVGDWQHKQLITGADYKTFTPLFWPYSRDKNFIYSDGERTRYDVKKHPRWLGQFIVDDDYVYTEEQHIMTGADAKTFEMILMEVDGYLQGTVYYRDNTYIYTSQGPIIGADRESFELINMNYAKDKNSVYNYDLLIIGADAESFEVFGNYSHYTKDKNYVYVGTKTLTGADTASFEVIWNNNGSLYAKDNNTYWRGGKKIGLPLDIIFDDDYIYLSDEQKIPRHGRDPWDVYQMMMKGDV